MRAVLETWGRKRWPEARVVHELVTGECRLDMAFVGPDHLVGVEIKSSRDTLDRLKPQLDAFQRMVPELWLALAPCWPGRGWSLFTHPGRYMPLVVDPGAVAPALPVQERWGPRGRVDRSVTAGMLELLWKVELGLIGRRRGLWDGFARRTRDGMAGTIARALTGDAIVAEVCRELRTRDAGWVADPPIAYGDA